MLPEDRDEIDEQDIEDVKINAREVSIPAQNAFLHSIIQHYHVDGQDGVLNPVGMLGQKLEADFHIIHGVRTRIQNTIRCVKELPLEVEDVVFNALASAQVVLTQHQKNLGALVIDIGGGTTDYILYVDGAVKQSGVPRGRRRSHHQRYLDGLAHPDDARGKAKDRRGQRHSRQLSAGRNGVVEGRFRFCRQRRSSARRSTRSFICACARHSSCSSAQLEEESFINYIGEGIFITGGCSQLSGIDNLAEEIFEMPARVAHAQTMSGLTSCVREPAIFRRDRLDQIRAGGAVGSRRPRRGFGRIFGKIFQRNAMTMTMF